MQRIKNEKGSVTIEMIGVLPYFFMLFLILWQAVASGYAVMNAQTAVNEAAKVYAVTEDVGEANMVANSVIGSSSAIQADTFTITPQESGVFDVSMNVSHGLIFVPEQWRSSATIDFNHSVTSKVIP